MKMIVNELAHNMMRKHAEECYPNECCGFFYGTDEGSQRKVTFVRKVKNAKKGDQSNRFQIDPVDYREAEKYALDNNLDLLGVYHSHPDHPAEPSEHDRKVAMPYFSYIILSVNEGKAADMRSWQLNENRQFDEENLEIKTTKR